MDAKSLGLIALLLGTLGVLLLAGVILLRVVLAQRSARALSDALEQRHAAFQAASARAAVAANASDARAQGEMPAMKAPKRFAGVLDRLARHGIRLLDTPAGKQIVSNEERRLLEQCGYTDARTRGIFLSVRLVCCVAFPLLAFLVFDWSGSLRNMLIVLGVAAAAGFLAPKLYISRRAAARRVAVIEEMPLLVDMMRLLQGVGLSLDQSIQVVTSDFTGLLPVLASEFGIAQRQYSAGRTREQSLQRLTNSFDNEDLHAIVRLLIQVDKHGGAVQEPFKQFGDRMREGRRALLRERIGKLTVKMTGVMILTLLPALFIVTAGPGMLAVLHSFAHVQNHS